MLHTPLQGWRGYGERIRKRKKKRKKKKKEEWSWKKRDGSSYYSRIPGRRRNLCQHGDSTGLALTRRNLNFCTTKSFRMTPFLPHVFYFLSPSPHPPSHPPTPSHGSVSDVSDSTVHVSAWFLFLRKVTFRDEGIWKRGKDNIAAGQGSTNCGSFWQLG